MTDVNFYAGGALDRAAPRRKDGAWIAALLEDAESRFVAIWRGQNLVLAEDGGAPRAALLERRAVAALAGEPVLLGLIEARAYFAVDVSSVEAPLAAFATAEPMAFTDLRRVGPLLPRQEGALLAYARGIAYWHERHRFCGVCGAPTRSEEGGHVRRCSDSGCATAHFPRTDPAVIMLVHDGERCLLGRKPGWPAGMHSTLAGFVEPGESLEEAVAREVFEETGIRVDEVAYHSSQPWPFPASLMLGFHARARSHEITVDPEELEHAAWYERGDLLARHDDDTMRLPRRDSIARRLVEDWLRR
ncbi:MAG TPA: NAD(+) diphosphatase [Stellaceae bacterium]|nr:NAD(+) diphosphatase [Stellaceae bacterium]